jgi:hypothetical protein
LSFTFQLVREDEDSPRAIVFEDSSTPGLVPVWEAAGVYDALYNSDGQLARDVSRRLAYGVDRLNDDPGRSAFWTTSRAAASPTARPAFRRDKIALWSFGARACTIGAFCSPNERVL